MAKLYQYLYSLYDSFLSTVTGSNPATEKDEVSEKIEIVIDYSPRQPALGSTIPIPSVSTSKEVAFELTPLNSAQSSPLSLDLSDVSSKAVSEPTSPVTEPDLSEASPLTPADIDTNARSQKKILMLPNLQEGLPRILPAYCQTFYIFLEHIQEYVKEYNKYSADKIDKVGLVLLFINLFSSRPHQLFKEGSKQYTCFRIFSLGNNFFLEEARDYIKSYKHVHSIEPILSEEHSPQMCQNFDNFRDGLIRHKTTHILFNKIASTIIQYVSEEDLTEGVFNSYQTFRNHENFGWIRDNLPFLNYLPTSYLSRPEHLQTELLGPIDQLRRQEARTHNQRKPTNFRERFTAAKLKPTPQQLII